MVLVMKNMSLEIYFEKQTALLDSNLFSGRSEPHRQLKLHSAHLAGRENNLLQGEISSNLLTYPRKTTSWRKSEPTANRVDLSLFCKCCTEVEPSQTKLVPSIKPSLRIRFSSLDVLSVRCLNSIVNFCDFSAVHISLVKPYSCNHIKYPTYLILNVISYHHWCKIYAFYLFWPQSNYLLTDILVYPVISTENICVSLLFFPTEYFFSLTEVLT